MSVLFQQHLSKFNTLLSNISAFSVKFEQHLIQHDYRYYLHAKASMRYFQYKIFFSIDRFFKN